MSHGRNIIPLAAIAGAAAASMAASYMMYKSVAAYGWTGTLRYIWEGDPYGPKIRDDLTTLDEAEELQVVYESQLNEIEEALERARLDSVDVGSSSSTANETNRKKQTKEIVKLWMMNFEPKNLEKTLHGLSHKLDELIASVDAVLTLKEENNSSSSLSSQILKDIKRRKKLLSKQLFLYMERCDALLASYQVLNE